MGEQLEQILCLDTPEKLLMLLSHNFDDPFKTLGWLDREVEFFIEECRGSQYQEIAKARALELKKLCEKWLSAIRERQKMEENRWGYDPIRVNDLLRIEEGCEGKIADIGNSFSTALAKLIEWKNEQVKQESISKQSVEASKGKRRTVKYLSEWRIRFSGSEYILPKQYFYGRLSDKVYASGQPVGHSVGCSELYEGLTKKSYNSVLNWRKIYDAVRDANDWAGRQKPKLPRLFKCSKEEVTRLV